MDNGYIVIKDANTSTERASSYVFRDQIDNGEYEQKKNPEY